jgi:RNA recognition motif-containing protein
MIVAKTFRYFDYDKKPCRALVYSNYLKEAEEPGIQKRKVLVKHLNRTVTSKTLEDRFAKYGSIVSSRVVLDENHKSLGYGFVVFEDINSAKCAQRAEFP